MLEKLLEILKRFKTLWAIILGIIIVMALMAVFKKDYSYFPKIFWEYKEKGKESQATLEDIQKGFK